MMMMMVMIKTYVYLVPTWPTFTLNQLTRRLYLHWWMKLRIMETILIISTAQWKLILKLIWQLLLRSRTIA
jgi:hypothetical protein